MSPVCSPSARHRGGFTLLEVIIVLSVLALFAGVALPLASTMFDAKARRATADELRGLAEATLEYFRDTGRLPGSASDLLVDRGYAGWTGPYVSVGSLDAVRGAAGGEVDAWHTKYAFTPLGASTLTLRSAGPDARYQTGDDLTLDVDVTAVRREVTLAELRVLNAAIERYNDAHLPGTPLPASYAALLATLVASGHLPASGDWDADGWGDAYAPDPAGVSPVVRVTSSNL